MLTAGKNYLEKSRHLNGILERLALCKNRNHGSDSKVYQVWLDLRYGRANSSIDKYASDYRHHKQSIVRYHVFELNKA